MIQDRHCVLFPGDRAQRPTIEEHHKQVMEGGEGFREVILKEILSDEQVQSLRNAMGQRRGSYCYINEALHNKPPPLLIRKPGAAPAPPPRPVSCCRSLTDKGKQIRHAQTFKKLIQLPCPRKRMSEPALCVNRNVMSTAYLSTLSV